MGECDDDPTQEQDDLLTDGQGPRYWGGTQGDVFIRTATGIRKVLPSIFNFKVVSDVTTTCDIVIQNKWLQYLHEPQLQCGGKQAQPKLSCRFKRYVVFCVFRVFRASKLRVRRQWICVLKNQLLHGSIWHSYTYSLL